MAIDQREVYLLPFPHNSQKQPHPFIVLSTLEANLYEKSFIAVMISSMRYVDDYSFNLTNEMFEKNLNKDNCHVRMHLLTLCLNRQIIGRRINKMQPFYFTQLMRSIGDIVFNYQFNPSAKF